MEPAPDDIFPPDACPVPVILPARCRTGPPLPKPARSLGMTMVSRHREDEALRSLPGPKPLGGCDATLPRPTARMKSTWPSGLASGAAGPPTRSTWTRRGRSSGIRPPWRPGGRPAGDPGRAGGRADWLVGVLPHRNRGERRRHPGNGRRPLQPGDHLPGLQGGRRGRLAASAIHVGEHRGGRLPVDVHADRGVAWGRKAEELVNRSASPWDTISRRPIHAGKRMARRRELMGEEIRATLRRGVTEEEIQAAADRLLNLAA